MAVDITTYGGTRLEKGYPGGVVDFNNLVDISLNNSGTIAIQPGTAVARGANDTSGKAPTADGDKIIGIAIRSATGVFDSSGNAGQYAQYKMVPVMRKGYLWAIPAENGAVDDVVVSITAQNGALGVGGAATGRVVVPGATWAETPVAGQITMVYIDN